MKLIDSSVNNPLIEEGVKHQEDYLVAVYGTLKRGNGNHRLLSDSEFIGTGCTRKEYGLKSMGGFPSIIAGNDRVRVEVYLVNPKAMSRLDQLEGYPSFYNREQVTITLENGKELQAWMYFVAQPNTIKSNPDFTKKDKLGWLNWNYEIKKTKIVKGVNTYYYI